MTKKILSAFILCFIPFVLQAQSKSYFPDRLIIKYESDQQLSRIKAKTGKDPQTEVQNILQRYSMRSQRSLFSDPLRNRLQHQTKSSVKELLKIREVSFNRRIDPIQLAAKISKMPGVAYAEPKYVHHLYYTPNDPIQEKFVAAHNFDKAWDLSQGSADVVIAIVDGGVNYNHPDLDDKLWVNQAEVPVTLQAQVDNNGDGTVTSTEIKQYLRQNGTDYNGDGKIALDDALDSGSQFMDNIDNDNNGFTDDLFGWDFWDSGDITTASSDNNPLLDGTDHGTHVAGIAAAEADNDTAVVGTGFNSSYMAVKAGGTPQDPRSIGFGFEGIIYAAQQGADIINCSWGGNAFSQAEQDVIDAATDMGSLVVAASGNEALEQVGYPAAYDKVVGVGSVETNDIIANYSNYGYKLDVLATGSNIRSTSYGDTLVTLSGTSMSTPVVSGLAALVKDVHPSWLPERIAMQIRSSARYINSKNSGDYNHRLGHGALDAFRALDTNLPGIKVVDHQFENTEGNKLRLGEDGSLRITITNLGNSTSELSLQLQTLNNGKIELRTTNQQVGSFSTGDTMEVSFDLTIPEDFDLSQIPTLRLNFRDNSQNYDDFSILEYNNILYDTVAANNVKTSFAANGRVGFTDPFLGLGGVGFIPRTPNGAGGYQDGDNLLFEGGLIMEIDGKIYDAVRATDGQLSDDFIPEEVFSTKQPGDISDADGSTTFIVGEDTSNTVTINLDTYAFKDSQLSNVVYLKYTIQNQSSFNILKNMYLGLFNDWDIGVNSSQNSVSYSASDSVLYILDDADNSPQPLVAVAQLGPTSSVLAIDNAFEGSQDSVTFGLYDGFTEAEKSRALHAQTAHTEVQNTDVSAVNASGPYTLNPGAEVTVGFVYAFGDDLDELRSQISAARGQRPFEVSSTGTAVSKKIPTQTELFQNYPNPFNPTTQIRFDLNEESDVQLVIFDVLGRKVRTLVDNRLQPSSYFIEFNGEGLSSGVYFARLKTESRVKTIPMTLIK